MTTTTVTEEAELDLEAFTPTPETATKISPRINDALAERLYAVASANVKGVSSARTYPSTEDAAYKADVTKFRKHLLSRVNTDTHRVAVWSYRTGNAVAFSLQIKARIVRVKKS